MEAKLEFTKEDIKALLMRLAAATDAGEGVDTEEAEALLSKMEGGEDVGKATITATPRMAANGTIITGFDFRVKNGGLTMHRYYLTQRPPMPGAMPGGFVLLNDYGEIRSKVFGGEVRHVYGWVEYDHPLTAQQIRDYELAEG